MLSLLTKKKKAETVLTSAFFLYVIKNLFELISKN
jgi:hypothetical protein